MEWEDLRWTRGGVSGHAVEDEALMFGPGLTHGNNPAVPEKRDDLRTHTYCSVRGVQSTVCVCRIWTNRGMMS